MMLRTMDNLLLSGSEDMVNGKNSMPQKYSMTTKPKYETAFNINVYNC